MSSTKNSEPCMHDKVVELIEEYAEVIQKQQAACDAHDDKEIKYLECLDAPCTAVKTAEDPKTPSAAAVNPS